ncbi:MAG: radical SAM protein [Spirochaetota bacterium]
MEHIFGPVPSRRLGRSIGVNNIPPKVCSYSCVYCQLGRAIEMTARRRAFFDPAALVEEARAHLHAARGRGEGVDYLTIVPDGEPTLDENLGQLVGGLKGLGVPVALITNSSLLGEPEVREALLELDWISVKVDAADEATWKHVDHPHKSLEFDRIIEGTRVFASNFAGTLTTETMLVDGVNDSRPHIDGVAELLGELRPAISYVSIPTRPPAWSWVRPAGETSIGYAYAAFGAHVARVENLIGYEGNEFAASGDARADLLSITAVHPMRHDAVDELLRKDGASQGVLTELLGAGELVEVRFGAHSYYVRGGQRLSNT